MAPRVEFKAPFLIHGQQGNLFVSSGRLDDYLELALPEGVGRDSPDMGVLESLERKTLEVGGGMAQAIDRSDHLRPSPTGPMAPGEEEPAAGA